MAPSPVGAVNTHTNSTPLPRNQPPVHVFLVLEVAAPTGVIYAQIVAPPNRRATKIAR